MSPESIEGTEGATTHKVDVYAFGMLMYEVAAREVPWADAAPHSIPEAVLAGERPTMRRTIRPLEEYEDMYLRCVAADPSSRPDVHELVDELKIMCAKVQEPAMVSTGEKVSRAPWRTSFSSSASGGKSGESGRGGLVVPDEAIVKLQASARLVTASSPDPWFKHVAARLEGIAATCTTDRTKRAIFSVLSSGGVGRVSFVEDRGAEMRFYTACEQLDRRFANLGDPTNPFHPCWRDEVLPKFGKVHVQTPADVAWRSAVVDRVLAECPNWARGVLENVRVVVGFHAVKSAAVADQILRTGFAALAKLDPGYFGQGLYFTPDFEYAKNVYAGDAGCVILCALCFGNPFPVIEHPSSPESMLGRPCMPRYDAHVAVVKREPGKGKACFVPAPPSSYEEEEASGVFSEIVLFDRGQILPLAVVHLV